MHSIAYRGRRWCYWMTDRRNNKGFSGLSSLASDVDEAAPQTRLKQEGAKPRSASAKASETRSEPQVVTSSSSQGAGTVSSGTKWLWGLVGAGVLIWLINATEPDGGRSTGGRSDTPSTPSPPPARTPSSPVPTQRRALEFLKPPVGQNNVLSVAQIRWCLKENIRIKTLRPLTMTNAQVDKFNAIVVDYNSRCASYRYREGTLERAHREVEQIRGQIVADVERKSSPISAGTGTDGLRCPGWLPVRAEKMLRCTLPAS